MGESEDRRRKSRPARMWRKGERDRETKMVGKKARTSKKERAGRRKGKRGEKRKKREVQRDSRVVVVLLSSVSCICWGGK